MSNSNTMFTSSDLYYAWQAGWLEGRPVWIKKIITAEEAQNIYNKIVERQRKEYALQGGG